MNVMDGCMFQFSTKDKNLLGFMSKNTEAKPCTNALIFIAGQTDGFLSLNYAPLLADKLLAVDYSLIQVNLSSSFLQFGFKSLTTDVEELTELVGLIKEKYRFQKIVFMGSSTGCQDSIYFLRHSELSDKVNAVILQGAVSDRDYIVTLPDTLGMLKEAKDLAKNHHGDTILHQRYFDAPITANRFLSLADRLGNDDMFSIDLTESELEGILSVVTVPTALCFSSQDEYVPNKEGQKVFAERMVKVLKKTTPVVECSYFDGDHGLSVSEHYEPFVEYVCSFVSSLK